MADVSVSLDLDAQQLYKELQQVQSHFASFAAKTTTAGEKASGGFLAGLKGGFSGIAGSISGLLGSLGIGAAIKAAFSHGVEVEEIHLKTGVSTDVLQRFGDAARVQFGTSQEALAKFFQFLEVNQAKAVHGNKGMEDAFKNLGFSLEDLKTKSLVSMESLTRLGQSDLSADDFKKVGGKGSMEVRAPIAALGAGALDIGGAISPDDLKKVKELDDQWKRLWVNIQIGIDIAIGAFADFREKAIAELIGDVEGLKKEFGGLVEALSKFKPDIHNLNPFTAFEHLKEAGQALAKGHEGAVNTRREVIDESFNERKDDRDRRAAKIEEISKKFAAPPEEHDEGDQAYDDEGRPLKKGSAESKAEKVAAGEEKLWQAEHDRYLKSIGYEERIVQLRKDAADALSASTESRDEEDQIAGGLKYYEILKDIDEEKKKHESETKSSTSAAGRGAKQDLQGDIEKERRALNPAGVSLEDYANATRGTIGNPRINDAKEALREEKLARRDTIAGNLGDATQHQNRAEELKKSLGLDNRIDRDKLAKVQEESRDILKDIKTNTQDIGANK